MSPELLALLARFVDAHAEAVADRVVAKLRETRPADADELLDATRAGVPSVTWRAAIRRGELRGSKVGRSYLARRKDVDAWLASLAVSASETESDPFERALSRGRDAKR